MHPSLKGYSSARAMSERASSRAEARSVSRVSSSIAMGIDKGRALVKNPAVPVDIIAKVAVIIPIQFACLFFLHLTYYKLPPNSFIFILFFTFYNSTCIQYFFFTHYIRDPFFQLLIYT